MVIVIWRVNIQSWLSGQNYYSSQSGCAAVENKIHYRFVSTKDVKNDREAHASQFSPDCAVTTFFIFANVFFSLTVNKKSCQSQSTCDGAGGRARVHGHVGLRWTVAVEHRHLLAFGHPMLDTVGVAGRSQQGLLGRGWGSGQVGRPDLLCHQLLLDFIDQD